MNNTSKEDMMKNKKCMFITTGVLIVVLATAGFAISGFKRHFGHHGKEFVKEHVLSNIDYTVQELRLTPDQQAEYSSIRDKMSSAMDTMSARHDATRTSMRTEIAAGDPDIKGMAETIKKEIAFMSDSANTQIDYIMEVYDILDPDQQKQVAARLKDHMNHRCGFDDD